MARRSGTDVTQLTTVDVVVPTLNASNLLRECLIHLARSSFQDFTLFVYDDGSTEDVAAAVRAVFPTAHVLRSESNRGLAHGCNRAIRAGSSEFVALLNNDVEVTTEWLCELVACARRRQDAGSIASKLLLWDRRSQIHSAGDTYSFRGVAGNRGVWMEDTGQFDSEAQVFAACGGAALYRRAALNAVAFPDGSVFDERLFMYYEDVDLAWRLQCAGFTCYFAPRAVVYHRLSSTAGGELASYYVARNALRVAHDRVPAAIRRGNRLRIAATHAGRVLRTLTHVREPAARASLSGTAAGIVHVLSSTEQAHCPREQCERIRGLLTHPSSEPFRGIPVARLGNCATAAGLRPVVGVDDGSSSSVANA
ncbi:MAG: glycosyltransferase family 2 protein [Chloroflexi bacterium]|nr:MAG: glycosyltransferase family 2 protein [Chloroflexota bacterium]